MKKVEGNKYLSFLEYCEKMEIYIITQEDYDDYIDYCEMNGRRYDILDLRHWRASYDSNR